jgi:hypothetical protein
MFSPTNAYQHIETPPIFAQSAAFCSLGQAGEVDVAGTDSTVAKEDRTSAAPRDACRPYLQYLTHAACPEVKQYLDTKMPK